MDNYSHVLRLCRDDTKLAKCVCQKLNIDSTSSRFSSKFKETLYSDEMNEDGTPTLLRLYQSATNYYDWEFLICFTNTPSSIQDKRSEIFKNAFECADSFNTVLRINQYVSWNHPENDLKKALLDAIKNKMIALGTLNDWLNVYLGHTTDKDLTNLALEQITRLVAEEIHHIPTEQK